MLGYETFLNILQFIFLTIYLIQGSHWALWGSSYNLFGIMKLTVPCFSRGLGRQVHIFVSYIHLFYSVLIGLV